MADDSQRSNPAQITIGPGASIVIPLLIGSAVIVVALVGTYVFRQNQIQRELRLRAEKAKVAFQNCVGLMNEGQYAEAEKQAEAAVTLDPDWATAYLFRAKSRAGQATRQKWLEALDDYDRALSLSPTRKERILAYFGRGEALLKLDRPRDAIGAFNSALHLNPHFAEIYLARAEALRKAGKITEAESDEKKAQRLGLVADGAARDSRE